MGEETRAYFFCEKRKAEEKSNYHKKLHKNTSNEHDPKKSTANQIIKIVDVPRCPRCKSIHNIGSITTISVGLVGGILWLWYFICVNNTILESLESNYDPELCRQVGTCPPILQFLLLGFICGLVMGYFIVNKCITFAIRPVKDTNDYILIVAAKDTGFE